MSDLTPKIITGLPNVKIKPKADLKVEEFDKIIISKGYRMYWSRAGICPCQNNDQTEQADPNCFLCHGRGYFYYLPDLAVGQGASEDIYGNPIELNSDNSGISIYVIKTSITADTQVFEKFGEWVFGVTRGTTQWENRLGYRDRLIERDSTMVWNQVVICDGGTKIRITGGFSKAGIRYPIVELIQFRSLNTVFREGVDFVVTAEGEIDWLSEGAGPPAEKTRLMLSYYIRPVWIVLDHIHTIRDTRVQLKAASVEAEFKRLPVQSMLKLDFLIDP